MNNPVLFPLLVMGGMLLLFVVVLRLAAKSSERTWHRVRELAASFGLEMAPPAVTFGVFHGQIHAGGNLRGKRVELFNYSTGSGKSRTTWSAVTARPPARTTLTFRLKKQGFGTKIAELFGVKEIAVGDPQFDAAWFVQTNQPDFLRAALVSELQAKLLAAQRAGANGLFELKDGVVKYAEIGGFSDARLGRFPALIDLVCDLADLAEVSERQ
jgi:hypothetical protein